MVVVAHVVLVLRRPHGSSPRGGGGGPASTPTKYCPLDFERLQHASLSASSSMLVDLFSAGRSPRRGDELRQWRAPSLPDLGRIATFVPPRSRAALVAAAHHPRVIRVVRRPRWGNLRRLQPFSHRYGHDRGGQAIDRYYIDRFIAANADDIRGRVLEVAEGRYANAHRAGVTELDVLDIDPRNPTATIVADLDDAESLPHLVFDCVLLTQTLQYVRDPRGSLRNIWSSLAPGGVLLMTVPSAAKIDHTMSDWDSWRVLPVGLRRLLEATCEGADVTVSGHGNLLATVAFLLGLAADELRPSELDSPDMLYPLVTCARAQKGGT